MMRDPLSWLPIKYKLPLTIAGIYLLAFGVGGFIISQSARSTLEKEIFLRLQAQSVVLSSVLDHSLELLGKRTEDFASDGFIRTRFNDLLKSQASNNSKSTCTSIYQELRRHLEVNKLPLVDAFQDVSLFNVDGRKIIESHSDTLHNNVFIINRAFKHDSVWFGNLIVAMNDHVLPIFVISVPVWDIQSARKIGYLVSYVNLERWIIAASNNYRMSLSHSGSSPSRFYLYDQNRVGVEVSFMDGNAVISNNLLNSGINIRIRNLSQNNAQVIPFHEQFGRYSNSDDKDVFAYRYDIPLNKWTVNAEVAAEQVMVPIANIQSRFLGTGIIIAVLTMIILYFPVKFLIRPLALMCDAARKMTGGDLSSRVQIESSDEIGDLAYSFNAMAKATEERTTKLEHTAGLLEKRSTELRLERDLLTTVVHSMNDGLVYLDRFGNIVLYNDAASQLVKIIKTKDALLAARLCSKDSKYGEDCLQCLVNPLEPTISCIVDFGEQVFEILATRLGISESAQGRILVSRDITERMRIDEQQAHQERLAVLGEVAGVMAHELNNPLAAISMYNQMMEKEFTDDSPYREHVEVIKRNTDICKKTIRGLLDYSSGTKLDIAEFNIHELISEVVRFLKPVYEISNVVFELHFRLGNALITSDEIYVRQVFVNLVLNAVQAMDAKGGHIILESNLSEDGKNIIIEIVDNGPGIPPEHQKKIFEPFFTSKKNGRGTGLGLATSRRILEAFHGALHLIESRKGLTRFRIQLPRKLQEGIWLRGPGETEKNVV